MCHSWSGTQYGWGFGEEEETGDGSNYFSLVSCQEYFLTGCWGGGGGRVGKLDVVGVV